MEFPFQISPWIITTTLIILLPIIVKIIVNSLFTTPRNNSNYPPGPLKLPIIGNLHQLASSSTTPPRRLLDLATVYGPIMSLQLGEFLTVVVSSAEAAKEFLRTHDLNFSNRPKFLAAKVIYYDSSSIGLAQYGEYWRQARKIATVELFTPKRSSRFGPLEGRRWLALSSRLGPRLVLVPWSTLVKKSSAFFSVSHRVAFNKKGKDQAAFRDFVTKFSKALSGFTIEDLYPSLKMLHFIGGMKKILKGMVEESNKILDPIIEEHKSKANNNEDHKAEEDLVDVLLKFHQDNVIDSSQFSLSTDNIKAIVLEIFGAGSETSSTTIEWAMSELLKSPRAMEKAQEEVRRVYHGKETIDETKLEELKYLKSVIKETFRLHPPAPFLVPRESIDECQIHGYTIPPKTRVMVNAYAIGRDPNYWSDPDVFEPERFENISIDFKGNNFELIPFGSGRRMCPGVSLGIVNIELPLAMLLYHFDWKLPVGVKPEDFDMEESFGITMRRKNDLHVLPIPRSSFVM